jgi:hypothetical protein
MGTRCFVPWLSWLEMTGEAPEVESGGGSPQRARLAVALGATFLLAAIVGVVLATGGSDDAPAAPTGTCFVLWNEDPIAPSSDGTHAYTAHGYRQTLVTRVDRNAQIVEDGEGRKPDSRDARCAVIFATPQPDFEPDFGVRVFYEGRWIGFTLIEGTTLDDIERLQADAVSASNAVLGSDGQLAEE